MGSMLCSDQDKSAGVFNETIKNIETTLYSKTYKAIKALLNKRKLYSLRKFLLRLTCCMGNLNAFHAIKDFDSLSQAISQSVFLNIFKRNLFKFVI